MNQIMYHTQENRGHILSHPIICNRTDAWLGTAYYFWGEIEDAIRWGYDSKRGFFHVYSARIISDKVLDTVYDRDHYKFFMDALERIASIFVEKTGQRLTKRQLCEYLNDKAGWRKEIDVLVINDTPWGKRELLPIPIRKRIQAAVYNKNCIHEFKLAYTYARS